MHNQFLFPLNHDCPKFTHKPYSPLLKRHPRLITNADHAHAHAQALQSNLHLLLDPVAHRGVINYSFVILAEYFQIQLKYH